MDAKQFRDILEIAKEFKVSHLKFQELEVNFHDMSFYGEMKPEAPLKVEPDADEQMLMHIEKLKHTALAGMTA